MERMTHERANGIKTGYWSPATKETLVQRLAAYENTGVSPQELQEVVNLFSEFIEPSVPAELQNWMERCVWHVQKCNDQHQEIERLRKELEIANGTIVPAAE